MPLALLASWAVEQGIRCQTLKDTLGAYMYDYLCLSQVRFHLDLQASQQRLCLLVCIQTSSWYKVRQIKQSQ